MTTPSLLLSRAADRLPLFQALIVQSCPNHSRLYFTARGHNTCAFSREQPNLAIHPATNRLSAFVFVCGPSAERRAQALRARLAEVSIEFDRERTTPEGVLLFRSNTQLAGADWLECDDGFACVTGTFFFRGLFGHDALRAFLRQLGTKRESVAECEGQFCLVVRKGDRLCLFTDILSMNKLYHDTDLSIFSSLFLGVAESIPSPGLDTQGCYEYAWIGAPLAERTFYADVRTLRYGRFVALSDSVAVHEQPAVNLRDRSSRSLTEAQLVERHLDQARSLFRVYAQSFATRVNVSMSGGYDSRLLLALLLDAGMAPRLFSYGEQDCDEGEAGLVKQLARAEHLPYECVDKTNGPRVSAAEYPARMKQVFGQFDGWKVDGIFDNLTDADDRAARVASGRVKMNGSAGEIYRNFFYLHDQTLSAKKLVWTFFARYDRRACTALFEPRQYENAIAATIARNVEANGRELERYETELAYPLVRVRYWTARDVQINQGFGMCLFPFLEPRLIAGTCDIPVAQKSYGIFEGRMIRSLSPRLASYPSAYGFSMHQDPPFRYRMKAQASYLRPPLVRRHLYRLQQRQRGQMPFFLEKAYLSQVIDATFPFMRKWFVIERLFDVDVLNRVATMEYHCQRHQARVA